MFLSAAVILVLAGPAPESERTLAHDIARDGDRAAAGPTALAAVALHESFHVDQRQRHPSWSGDEGQMMLYPTSDADLLGLRRRESEALRRALAAADDDGARCWVAAAMAAP